MFDCQLGIARGPFYEVFVNKPIKLRTNETFFSHYSLTTRLVELTNSAGGRNKFPSEHRIGESLNGASKFERKCLIKIGVPFCLNVIDKNVDFCSILLWSVPLKLKYSVENWKYFIQLYLHIFFFKCEKKQIFECKSETNVLKVENGKQGRSGM